MWLENSLPRLIEWLRVHIQECFQAILCVPAVFQITTNAMYGFTEYDNSSISYIALKNRTFAPLQQIGLKFGCTINSAVYLTMILTRKRREEQKSLGY